MLRIKFKTAADKRTFCNEKRIGHEQWEVREYEWIKKNTYRPLENLERFDLRPKYTQKSIERRKHVVRFNDDGG